LQIRLTKDRRDFRLLLAARVLRAFGFGFSAILVAVHLQSRGLSPAWIGVVLAVGLGSASFTGLAAAWLAARIGRRRTLALVGVLMMICGVDLALAPTSWLLLLAGLTGMMGLANADLGPFLAVEQAMLTETTTASGRNRAFGRYSFTGAIGIAAGGLAASGGTSLNRTIFFYWLFAALGLVTALLPLFLSTAVEGEVRDEPAFGSLRPLIGLSALFALDSLGGGLVVNAVIVYWLHIRFKAGPELLGPSFAAMSVLGAFSLEVAGWLADRIGLVNTMVFTHLPSNVLLILVPFAPSLPWALGLLLVRSLIVSMDQPARQAYVVSIVPPNERGGALAVTGAVRGVALAAGPAVTGIAIQAAALGLPFFAGGGIKSLYDLALWAGFRHRFGDHEARARLS
jgi:MFS family permease